jgi:hypothetical protein
LHHLCMPKRSAGGTSGGGFGQRGGIDRPQGATGLNFGEGGASRPFVGGRGWGPVRGCEMCGLAFHLVDLAVDLRLVHGRRLLRFATLLGVRRWVRLVVRSGITIMQSACWPFFP